MSECCVVAVFAKANPAHSRGLGEEQGLWTCAIRTIRASQFFVSKFNVNVPFTFTCQGLHSTRNKLWLKETLL